MSMADKLAYKYNIDEHVEYAMGTDDARVGKVTDRFIHEGVNSYMIDNKTIFEFNVIKRWWPALVKHKRRKL